MGFLAVSMLLTAAGCQSFSNHSLEPGVPDLAQPAISEGAALRFVAALPPVSFQNIAMGTPVMANDVLEIDVFEVDTLDRTVRVNDAGFISMPLVGRLKAAGHTVSELEAKLEELYAKTYLQAPDITVSVAESVAQKVTLDGEFKQPGLYPATHHMTLVRAVAGAGGLTNIADERRLYVFRQVGPERHIARYSLADARAGRVPDVRLKAGDVVVAFASGRRVAMRNLREALAIAVSASDVARPY